MPDDAMNVAFEEYRKRRYGPYNEYPIEAYTHFCNGWKAAEREELRQHAKASEDAIRLTGGL